MLSKGDYAGYLQEMFEVEHKMHSIYSELSKKISDPDIKAIIDRLIQEESAHEDIVGLLKKSIPGG